MVVGKIENMLIIGIAKIKKAKIYGIYFFRFLTNVLIRLMRKKIIKIPAPSNIPVDMD